MPKNNGKDISKIVDKETAEEKLGPDIIEQIAEKEWKTAPLPTEEELAKEKGKSPKSRNNPNSRRNLTQYNPKKKKETKKKIVESLPFKKVREEINAFDYIAVPENYDTNKIKAFLPNRKALKSAEEEIKFYTILNEFLRDFDLNELSSSDMEDVISLSMNRIIESRLLESAVADPNMLLDVSASIEKYRRHSEKLKQNLASTRSHRIDPRDKQNFSIVDLVVAFDDEKKKLFDSRLKKMRSEEEEYKENRERRLKDK